MQLRCGKRASNKSTKGSLKSSLPPSPQPPNALQEKPQPSLCLLTCSAHLVSVTCTQTAALRETGLELTPWFKICQNSLYGDGGTECGSLEQQYFWSSRDPSQMTFWSQMALLNLVTGKVKATSGDHDHFIDKPSYPLGSTTSQHEHLTNSCHFTQRPHAFPATVHHSPSDHTQTC